MTDVRPRPTPKPRPDHGLSNPDRHDRSAMIASDIFMVLAVVCWIAALVVFALRLVTP